ncbi:MAG: anthranilate synthase component I, partial [Pyrobaculum sp.]
MRKIPLSKLPTPRELAASLYGSGEFVVLLESGMGYAERSRYTLVAWGVEEEYVSYGVDLQRVLERAYGALSKYPSPLGGDVVVGFLTYDA